MDSLILREYTPGDVPEMQRVWQEAFGDPLPLIRLFYDRLPAMGTAVTAVVNGKVVGIVHVITGFTLPDGTVCGYLYAGAVEESCRGQGIGAALIRAAEDTAYARGAGVSCMLPADAGLYRWYERLLGFVPVLRREKHETACTAALPVEKLSYEEYMRRRETLLRGKPHVTLSGAVMEFEQCFAEFFGGGLFACGNALCAAYADGDCAVIHELLTPDGDASAAAAAVGYALGCERAEYYLPAPDGEPYIAALPGAIPADCVWNFAFD